jgi:hypothetical protein
MNPDAVALVRFMFVDMELRYFCYICARIDFGFTKNIFV